MILNILLRNLQDNKTAIHTNQSATSDDHPLGRLVALLHPLQPVASSNHPCLHKIHNQEKL